MRGARAPLSLTLSPRGRGNSAQTMPCQLMVPKQRATDLPEPLHPSLTWRPQQSSLFIPPPEGGRVGEGVATVPAYRNDSHRLLARAQRADMTPSEKTLWEALRNHRFQGLSIRRKAPVGPWIADFLIPSRRIAICILPETAGTGADHPPHGALERLGYVVLRPAAADLTPARLPTFLRLLAATARVTP